MNAANILVSNDPQLQLTILSSAKTEDLLGLEEHLQQQIERIGDLNCYLCLALLYWRIGKNDRALILLDQANAFGAETSALAQQMRGMVCRQLPGLQSMAKDAYEKSIRLDPSKNDCLYNLANLVVDDDPEYAKQLYFRSLYLDPMMATAWHNLGKLFLDQDNLDHAFSCLALSIRLDPFVADVWCNLGLAYLASENYVSTELCLTHAISLDSNHAQSHINMGSVMIDVLGPEQALSYLHRGAELDSCSANSLWNLSLAYLLLGDFEKGWEYYEARFSTVQFDATTVPTSGSSPSDLSECCLDPLNPLVVWCEQGIGDSIQFIRYVYLLEAASIPFVVITRPGLEDLFNYWLNLEGRVYLSGELPPSYANNQNIALMSLPRLFKTRLSTIPSVTPYFHPPSTPHPGLTITKPSGGLSVGIVWATNPDNKSMYRHKSFKLDWLMPKLLKLVELDLIDVHGLQVGPDANQIQPWSDGHRVFDWSNKLKSFGDTASLVSQLDLVISADTGVAHLAGALHRPTWLLLPFNADFRWMRERSDTPWYPSMRLFRQKELGDWDSVMNQVFTALDSLFSLEIDKVHDSEFAKGLTHV